VVEVAVIALAALALLLLQRRGLVESSAAVGVDPLLAAAPVLVAAAVGLLVLRLYPLPLRAIHSAARRRAVPAVSLGSARAIREPAVGVVAILALVVGMSMVVFTAVMVSTVGASILQSAADQVGADVRVSAHDIPDSLVSEIADLPAVTDAVSLVSKSGVDFTDESGPVAVTVVLADTELLNRIRPDIPRLGGKSDGAIPVLISDDWDSQIDGTELSLVNSKVVEAGTIATGALPGMSRHWLLVDISAADELGLAGQSPYTILASLTDPDDGRGPVADEIEALVAAAQPAQFAGSLRVETAAALADQMSTAPVVGAVQLALVVVAAGTLLLTALVVALATAAAAALRGRVLGVVRVLGMSRRQVAALTAWELAPAAIASLAVAAGLGIAIPYIVLAALDLRGFFGGNLAPVPTVDPVLLVVAVGVFVGVVVVASAAATVIGRRAAPARTIRMGE
jgi:putative ABC transport system permease protein